MIPLQKVKEIIIKYDNLEKDLSAGNIDPKIFAKKSKEYANLRNIINTAKEYINFEKQKRDLEQILDDKNNDKEMFDLAKNLDKMIIKKENYENKLKIFLLPKDEDDDKNAIVKLGRHWGLEATLFCADLFKMYEKFAQKISGFRIDSILRVKRVALRR